MIWPRVCIRLMCKYFRLSIQWIFRGVNIMPLSTILLILLILLLLGAIPAWPHSRSWGYGPTGGLGLVLIIVLILALLRVF